MNEVAKLSQVRTFGDLLTNGDFRQRIAECAVAGLKPDRVLRILAAAGRNNKALMECSALSIAGAVMTATSLGLELNSPLGHAYLIPFKQQVQLVIGYAGYLELARRTGEIKHVIPGIHYSDDPVWQYEIGSRGGFRHEPGPGLGEPQHAYAWFELTSGGVAAVLPWARVMQARDASQGYQSAKRYNKSHPWITNEPEMAMKTAIRYAFQRRMVPVAIESYRAAAIDGAGANYAAVAIAGNPEDAIAAIEDAREAPMEPPIRAAEAEPEPEPARLQSLDDDMPEFEDDGHAV